MMRSWRQQFAEAAERGVQDVADPAVAAEREVMRELGRAALAELPEKARAFFTKGRPDGR